MRITLPYSKVVAKPLPVPVPANPQTLGEHIRKARLERGLMQKAIADLFGVCEDSVTGWESNRSQPQIRLMPCIISYLGYYPFDHSPETASGRIDRCRHLYGVSYQQLGEMLGADGSTVQHWKRAGKIFSIRCERLLLNLLEAKQSPS